MFSIRSTSVEQTEQFGELVASYLTCGDVIAMFGGLGMGKTAFVRGLAKGRNLSAEVSSPTFALVHDYGGNPPLVHFDMYRISSWDDLYSTGFFDYLDAGAICAVEWSENIAGALPDNAIHLTFERTEDSERIITVSGEESRIRNWESLFKNIPDI